MAQSPSPYKYIHIIRVNLDHKDTQWIVKLAHKAMTDTINEFGFPSDSSRSLHKFGQHLLRKIVFNFRSWSVLSGHAEDVNCYRRKSRTNGMKAFSMRIEVQNFLGYYHLEWNSRNYVRRARKLLYR